MNKTVSYLKSQWSTLSPSLFPKAFTCYVGSLDVFRLEFFIEKDISSSSGDGGEVLDLLECLEIFYNAIAQQYF